MRALTKWNVLGIAWIFIAAALSTGPAQAQFTQTKAQNTANKTSSPDDNNLGEVAKSGLDLLVSALKSFAPSNQERSWQSYGSPRETVFTFMHAMREVRQGRDAAWSDALRALDGENTASKRGAAQAIMGTLERLGDLQPYELPGGQAVERRDIKRYELFPYGIDHRWIWESLDSPPEGSLVLSSGEGGLWRFTPETVNDAQGLYASLKSLPPRYEEPQVGHVFISALGPLGRTPWWCWLVAVGATAAGLVAAYILGRVLHRGARKADEKDHPYIAATLRNISKPLGTALFAVAVAFGFSFVDFSPALNDLRWVVVRALVTLAGAWLVLNLVDVATLGLRRLTERNGSRFDQTATLLLRRTLRTVTLVLVGIFFLQNLLGIQVGALLAGVGIAGIALSLAGQGFLKNGFGAFNIFINQPFLIGDIIKWENQFGTIEDVGLYATKVRLFSGEMLTVPNMQFIDQEVENISERFYLRRDMSIAIPYDLPAGRVQKALDLIDEALRDETIAREGRFDPDKKPHKIFFSDFAEYYLHIRVFYWYFFGDGETPQREADRNWYDYLDHCTTVNTAIKKAFDANDIPFAFPTETNLLANDPDRPLQVGLGDSGEAPHDGKNGSKQHEITGSRSR